MQAFTFLDTLVAPLERNDVDTDALIPRQFLKSISRTGLGPFLFDDWRYLDRGELGQDCSRRPLAPGFRLNQPRYAGTRILLSRDNFGCGSSRKHAVWALEEYGFRAVIASSFADIFYGNCLKNGLLPIVLAASEIDRLLAAVQATPGYRLRVDLAAQTVTAPDGEVYRFAIDSHRKQCLLEGLDDIGLTLQAADRIRAYGKIRRGQAPWLFASCPNPLHADENTAAHR